MNYKLEEVKEKDKDILYSLLQFALYDGSKYIHKKQLIFLFLKINR